MLAVTVLMTLMIFMWAAAIWASWADEDSNRLGSSGTDSGALTGA